MTKHIDIVFDGSPGPVAPRFVEVEDDQRAGMRIGRWIKRDDGYWVLRITPTTLEQAITGEAAPVTP